MTKSKFPLELLESLTVITKPSFPIANCADYAAGTSKGYLIEIKRNIIVQNIYVAVTDIVDLFGYYDWIANDCCYYYIIRGSSGSLVVVQKEDKCLKIVEKRDSVQNIRIRDVDNSGHANIVLNDNVHAQVLTISKNNKLDQQLQKLDSNSHSLFIKLQDLQGNCDALAKEYEIKKRLIEQHLETAPQHTKLVEPPLSIVAHHSKLHLNHSLSWLLLLQIQNLSDRCINDLQLFPCHHYVDELSWHLVATQTHERQLAPYSKNFIAILARLPIFGRESGMAAFEVRYETKNILKTAKFNLSANDVASGRLDQFNKSNDFDIDMICLRTTHFTYSCNLELTPSVIKHIVSTQMGLQELRSCIGNDVSHYFGQSSAFFGLFITLQRSHDSQRLTIYSKNCEQMDIFKQAFNDCLPDGTNLDIMNIQTPCII